MNLEGLMQFLPFLVVCGLAALTGLMFPGQRIYAKLVMPSWAPPGWVYPLVWLILYIAIAVAGWRISLAPSGPSTFAALVAWFVQIVINGAWTPLFFGIRRYDIAFYVAVAMFLAIAATIVLAWPVELFASVIMLPYLGWIGFACVLNWAVLQLNGKGPEPKA